MASSLRRAGRAAQSPAWAQEAPGTASQVTERSPGRGGTGRELHGVPAPTTMRRLPTLAAAFVLLAPAAAVADVDVSLRAGAGTIALDASSDTPVVGGRFDDAVEVYNGAADAYNRAHNYRPGSEMAAP